MGAVLRAEHQDLGKVVAIKVLPLGHKSMRELRHRFRREARAMSLVDHPNIVGILDAELDHEPPYLVMELVEGKSLEDRVGPTARPWARDDVLELGLQLAQGLAAIHRAGLVHRDLKPANVLHDEARGAYRIADLGLAGGQAFTVLTKEGDILGTPAYLAPEAWVHETMGPAGDVFQVGVMLYEAWTADAPYGRTLEKLMVNVQRGLAPDDRIGDEPLARVVRGCLEVDPKRRYGSGSELLRALQAVARADRSQNGGSSLVVLPSAPLPSDLLPPPPARAAGPGRGMVLLVAGLVGLGAGLLGRSQGPTAPEPPPAATTPVASAPEPVALRPEGLRVLVEGPEVELSFRTPVPRRARLMVSGEARAEGPATTEHRLPLRGLPAVRGWPRAVLELVAEDGMATRWPLPDGLEGRSELLAAQVEELTREVWGVAREPWYGERLPARPGRLGLVEALVERGLVDRAERLGRGLRAFLDDRAQPVNEKWLLYQALGRLADLEAIGPDPRRAAPLLGVEAWLDALVRPVRREGPPEGARRIPERPEESPWRLAPRELVRPSGGAELVELPSELAIRLDGFPTDHSVWLMVERGEDPLPGLVLELEGAADLRLSARDARGQPGELVGWRLAPGAFGPRGRRGVLRQRPPVPGLRAREARFVALHVWAEPARVHSGP
jgi:hypothetical protein